MGAVVKGLDKALASMDLEKVRFLFIYKCTSFVGSVPVFVDKIESIVVPTQIGFLVHKKVLITISFVWVRIHVSDWFKIIH